MDMNTAFFVSLYVKLADQILILHSYFLTIVFFTTKSIKIPDLQ